MLSTNVDFKEKRVTALLVALSNSAGGAVVVTIRKQVSGTGSDSQCSIGTQTRFQYQ